MSLYSIELGAPVSLVICIVEGGRKVLCRPMPLKILNMQPWKVNREEEKKGGKEKVQLI
jgi:hypothetical protein